MILAGDVGGTNSRLGLFSNDRQPIFESTLKNAGRASLPEVVSLFLKEAGSKASEPIQKACFGVAGPVSDGKVILTNLQWKMDEVTLASELKVPKLALINDMVAHAEGVELLKPEHLVTLNVGQPVHGATRAIIAAGTGLGESGMVYDPKLADGPRRISCDAVRRRALRFLPADRSGNCAAAVPAKAA